MKQYLMKWRMLHVCVLPKSYNITKKYVKDFYYMVLLTTWFIYKRMQIGSVGFTYLGF